MGGLPAPRAEDALMSRDGEDSSREPLPKPGDVLVGKFRIERLLREGGMGAIFVARHEVLSQSVAVKVLLAEAARDEVTVARFLREARAAARLQSEHVARVMDAGVLEGGVPFLVMELLEGCDLAELLRLSGPLSATETADYLLQAIEGVAHAHAAGIIHRDLKPSNLFLALRPDGTNVIKVLDFGISKSRSADDAKFKTVTGRSVLGSPAYMSPEQIRNAKTVDERSDVWSLGVTAYELLTGRLPFDGDGVGEILAAVLERPPPPIGELRAGVPEGIEQVVGRCLAKSPDARFDTLADLARALAPFISPRSAPLIERIEKTLVRSGRVPTLPDNTSPSVQAMTTVGVRRPSRGGAIAIVAGVALALAVVAAVAVTRVSGGPKATARGGRAVSDRAAQRVATTALAEAPVFPPTVDAPAPSGSSSVRAPPPWRGWGSRPPQSPSSRPPILHSRD